MAFLDESKKRVAILSTHRANNFGAMLQAYSLVEMCKELGADAELLDWRCPHYERMYHLNRIRGLSLRALWYNWWKLLIERKSRKMFEAFRRRLKMSAPIYLRSELENAENAYDVFITGSDQVWNPINSAPRDNPEAFDRAYLLDFVRQKSKNSYAASIGVPEIKPDSLKPEFVEAWRTFDVISTREHAGAELVARMSGHPAITVLDPVLLHDAKWWTQRCVGSIHLPKRYVFEYNVSQIEELDKAAISVSRSCGCKLVKPIIPGQARYNNIFGWDMGPEDFVNSVCRADCVLTSSFHCAAFALIFRKKLYLATRNDNNRPNSRFDSLFRFANLEPKIVRQNHGEIISTLDFARLDETQMRKIKLSSIELLKGIVS